MYIYTCVCVYLCVHVPPRNACSALLLGDLETCSSGSHTTVGLPNSRPIPLSPSTPNNIYTGFHPFLPLLPEVGNNANVTLETFL